jgi:hypothetical protein
MPPKPNYLRYFPGPLLEDLVAGQWFPIIGAGFSRNAILPPRKKMPLWDDLGKALGSDLDDYSPSHALDAISAFEHEFGRPKLIERLSRELFVDEARPGDAHRAFCSIQFDIVCTTNFDFLLERQYDLIPRPCTPLIEETQLSIRLEEAGVALLKLHGDLHHPDRMVASEGDYEIFLERFPLLATYLANLLIGRTAVLIGYSLDDPDFRQIWRVVGERLGRFRRPAYAIMVNAGRTEIARFQRRGVKVINLPSSKDGYGKVLAETFTELATFWRDRVIGVSLVRDEHSLRELSLPSRASTRLCFFAVPLSLQSFYREQVFPIFQQLGFVPVTADDVVSPGDVVQAKIEAILERAYIVVVDVSTQFTLAEWRFARRIMDPNRILVIAGSVTSLPAHLREARVLIRPDVSMEYPESFIEDLRGWLMERAQDSKPRLQDEPARLFRAGELRASVISAVTLLETTLRERLKPDSFITLRALISLAEEQQLLAGTPVARIMQWLKIRNQVVHTSQQVSRPIADAIVRGVGRIVAENG